MVESGKEYVLQWTGHAAHVTERFAGLLARQALVDVTLICQGQKLRVHKLVLASCSLYFEEMLEQDLGQEPIILLRDLDFEVLKAMVEFMYCGETTVSHCHLQTLLDAAQVFKVKELECIVQSMLETNNDVEDVPSEPEDSEGVISSSSDRRKAKMRPNRQRHHSSAISTELNEDSTFKSTNDQTLETIVKNHYDEDEAKNLLYESPEFTSEIPSPSPKKQRQSPRNISNPSFNSSDDERSKISPSPKKNDEAPSNRNNENSSPKTDETSSLTVNLLNYPNDVTTATKISTLANEKNCPTFNNDNNHDLSINVGECSKVYTHKKRKYTDSDDYAPENSSDWATDASGIDENPSNDHPDIPQSHDNDDKRLKVYTRKRRKSLNRKKILFNKKTSDFDEEKFKTTSCIDLTDEITRENPPITLSSTLDMETSEYVWSLSSDHVNNSIGCSTTNQFNPAVNNEDEKFVDDETIVDLKRKNTNVKNNKTINKNITELFSDNENRGNVDAPVLRRSVRINQLENDDSLNNNNACVPVVGSTASKTREKHLNVKNDDYSCNNVTTVGRPKRRTNKETDCRVPDENNVTTTTTQSCLRGNENNSRSLRSASKIVNGKTTGKTRCSLPKNYGNEQKTRNNVRMKKLDNTNCDVLLTTRLNTIASVDRALWGDMSDVLENRNYEGGKFADERSENDKEIPFALGLLPLRAALERMQATLDHQPRKTRSSVAPLRQEINGGKRKDGETMAYGTRRKDGGENYFVNGSDTVCHIRIRTSSETMDDRRNTRSDEMVAVGSSGESNGR